MKTRLILLVLVLGAGKLLYDAGGSEAATSASDTEHATVLASGRQLGSRLYHGVGVIGARLVAPAVNGMLRDHRTELAELEAPMRQAPPSRRNRARGVAGRVAQLDSMAVVRLESGAPVAALKYALQSGGLMDVVRGTVMEEALIK